MHSASRAPDPNAVPFPKYWSSPSSGRTDFAEHVPLKKHEIARLQQVFDASYRNFWTRDRKRHSVPGKSANVPKGFEVVSALRNENSRLWSEYCIHRADMLEDRAEADQGLSPLGPYQQYSDVKTMPVFGQDDSIRPTVNEWYLFHGTSKAACIGICQTDFKINLAGGNTGTLYGRGSYFAESITKADEYAEESEGTYTMLLCRVLGGRVYYTDAVDIDDPDAIVRSCLEGPYDCVIGDREKCRGTYREFIVYDSESVYPEYLITYKRTY